MTIDLSALAYVSDTDLLAEVKTFAARERQATVWLIASLAELDARRLYLGEGCSSLFAYCTQILHLSEHAAYGRITAARAARWFPLILDMLGDGSLNVTSVGLLAPHLTAENHQTLLKAVRHKSKRDVEHVVAALRPQPAVPAVVRKLPTPKSAQDSQTPPPIANEDQAPTTSRGILPEPSRPVVIKPLAPERYKMQFTVSRETYEKLRRAQDLLRHAIPTGDPAAIVERALTLLIADLEKKKLASAARPRPDSRSATCSRYIPASVRREVWSRDGGRCAFVGTQGRCTERGFLEFHHVVPYAAGGKAVAENLELRCRAHNAYEADLYFGPPQSSFVREVSETYFCFGIPTRSGPS